MKVRWVAALSALPVFTRMGHSEILSRTWPNERFKAVLVTTVQPGAENLPGPAV